MASKNNPNERANKVKPKQRLGKCGDPVVRVLVGRIKGSNRNFQWWCEKHGLEQ